MKITPLKRKKNGRSIRLLKNSFRREAGVPSDGFLSLG
jgi:hypothetical protein